MKHKENHFKSSALISDIVIGMSDGLPVPFAFAAGLSGAVHSNVIIIMAVIAEIAASSIAKVVMIGIAAAMAAFVIENL